MRIAIDTLFEDPDRPTGSLDYLRLMVRELPRAGPQHEYCLLASDRNRSHFQDAQAPNVRVLHCFCSNEKMPARVLQQQTLIPWLLHKEGVDVLFAPGNVSPLWGSIPCVLKINTLHHCHIPQLLGPLRAGYRTYFFAASARRAAHVIANTQMAKREIHQFMHVPDEKISVVAEPMWEGYRPVPREKAAAILRQYGLVRDYILFVSNLYPYKNAETLLRAFAQPSLQKDSAMDLVIVGRDCNGQLAKLQSLTNLLGLHARVHFLGFLPIEHMPAIYSQARVFVFPSQVETFGKPLIEAMQCGVPVVASDTSCMPEVLGGAGLLMNSLEPAEMASTIHLAHQDGSLRDGLIERGLRRGQQFSAQAVARETLAILENALEETGTARERIPA